ncbi:unnamed protein product [Symbiodinium sp. CCMP2592]|nr:unnamed protein product [Symbiodinium sp. CCMP2592]
MWQELQWLFILGLSVIYGLQATGLSARAWNLGMRMLTQWGSRESPIFGPDPPGQEALSSEPNWAVALKESIEHLVGLMKAPSSDPPAWGDQVVASLERVKCMLDALASPTPDQGVRDALTNIGDIVEESKKLLFGLAAKRPHLDLLPDIQTACDVVRDKLETGVCTLTPQARAEDRAFAQNTLKELNDLGKGQQSLHGEYKEVKQLCQETKQKINSTYGLEGIYHHISTVLQSQKNFGASMPKIIKCEHDELKVDIESLCEKIVRVEEAQQHILTALHDVQAALQQKSSPPEPVQPDGQHPQAPYPSPASNDNLRVPDYVPSIPVHQAPASPGPAKFSLEQALGPGPSTPPTHFPMHGHPPTNPSDLFATMSMCLDMMKAMQQHQSRNI